jgi:two-component system cell cycle response regulator
MALGGLTKLVTKFMEEQPEGVVLLDGLEYLVTNNGFQQVLLFLEGINEFVMARNNILLVPVSPAALEVREMALLERSLQPLQEAEAPERETLAGRVTVEDVINLLEKY